MLRRYSSSNCHAAAGQLPRSWDFNEALRYPYTTSANHMPLPIAWEGIPAQYYIRIGSSVLPFSTLLMSRG